MKVPILYPQHRHLAAEALWGAANQLERLGQTAEAATLYREIITEHPSAMCAPQARQRVEDINVTKDEK